MQCLLAAVPISAVFLVESQVQDALRRVLQVRITSVCVCVIYDVLNTLYDFSLCVLCSVSPASG